MDKHKSRDSEVNNLFDVYSPNEKVEMPSKPKMNETIKLHDSHQDIIFYMKKKSGFKNQRDFAQKKKISNPLPSNKFHQIEKYQDFSKVDLSNDFDDFSEVKEEPKPLPHKVIYEEEKKFIKAENVPKVNKPCQNISNQDFSKVDLSNDFDVFRGIPEKPEPPHQVPNPIEIQEKVNNIILNLNPAVQAKLELKLKKERDDLKISKTLAKSLIQTVIDEDFEPFLQILADKILIESIFIDLVLNFISESNEIEEDSQNPISLKIYQNKDIAFSIQYFKITQIVQSALNDLTSKAVNNARKKFCRFNEKIAKSSRIELKEFVILYRDSVIFENFIKDKEQQRDQARQENEKVKKEIERVNQDIEGIIKDYGNLETAYRQMQINELYLNLTSKLYKSISEKTVKCVEIDYSEFDI